MKTPLELNAEALKKTCTLASSPFETTDDLQPVSPLHFQPRVRKALEFGCSVTHRGFHLYVMGPEGIGKHELVKGFLHRNEGQARPDLYDWLYIPNLQDACKPEVLKLPAGQGRGFMQDMEQLISELPFSIEEGLVLSQYPQRLLAAQKRIRSGWEPTEGNPPGLSDADSETLRKLAKTRLEGLHQWRKTLTELNRESCLIASGYLFDELEAKYASQPGVLAYMKKVREDLSRNFHLVVLFSGDDQATQVSVDAVYFNKYLISLLVDNQPEQAPVVYEPWPSIENLFGKITSSTTGHEELNAVSRITAGALHRANGGYLVLDAYKLLQNSEAWDGLKRTLRLEEILMPRSVEPQSQQLADQLRPQRVPLDVKVLLIGERILYDRLMEDDPDFAGLFKVGVDFDDAITVDDETTRGYCGLIADLARQNQLHAFARDAVALLMEQMQRLIENQKKIALHLGELTRLMIEADYWSRQHDRSRVTRIDVEQAIEQFELRHERPRLRQLEEYLDEDILLDTTGSQVGQVNALVVTEWGDISFGHPVRVTSTVRVGEGELVDIEREVELGGAIHSKGVYILNAFMASRYSHNRPLSLAATLVFEQSYSMIDGDSASTAELCALLSALANVPIKQSLAITGAVNQRGQVQSIGGVNEKIEGFFELCQLRGLSGEQGVIIPACNVQNLMLRPSVIEAVRDGTFHIHAVGSVDEALSLLSGMPAGEADAQGNFPADSVNGKVDACLQQFAELRHEFCKDHDEHEDGHKEHHH